MCRAPSTLDVLRVEVERTRRSDARVDQVSDDFVLPVDRDCLAASEFGHVDAMASPVEADVDPFVPQPAAFAALRRRRSRQQIDGALLEHAGSHAIDHVLAIAVFDDDRVDAVEMEQVAEQQAGRACADNAYLRSQPGHATYCLGCSEPGAADEIPDVVRPVRRSSGPCAGPWRGAA